jgi:hypothetical protein
MSSYDDQAQIQALYAEQQQIQQALTILEDYNGTVPSFTVAAVPVQIQPTAGQPFPSSPAMPAMPVTITTTDPGQNLIAACHANLTQRYNEINKELRQLGVTGTPPAHAQGGPKED